MRARLLARLVRPSAALKVLSGTFAFAAAASTENRSHCLPAHPEEAEHMVHLLNCVGWKPAWHKDMERQNVGDIMSLMGYSNARLSLDPPDPATMTAVLTCLTTDSVCTGTDSWPDAASTNVADIAAWTNVRTQLVILCRLAASERKASEARLLARHRIAPPVSAEEAARLAARNEEDRKKNHTAEVNRLVTEASALYNRQFIVPGETAIIMETRLAFDKNQLRLARLNSGKYGRPNVHIAERPKVGLNDEHELEILATDFDVPLSRNANVLVQIGRALDSLVISGHGAIDPSVAHLAGKHGRVNLGLPAERQVNYDLTSATRTFTRFVILSGSLGPQALGELFDANFVPALGELMEHGHSACSGTADMLANASWLKPAHSAIAPALSTSASIAGAASSSGRAPSTTSDANPEPEKYRIGSKNRMFDKDNKVSHVSVEQVERERRQWSEQRDSLKSKLARSGPSHGSGGRGRSDYRDNDRGSDRDRDRRDGRRDDRR